MNNLQIFEILKSFTNKEFSDFGRFVKSPYFNNRSEVIRFYEAIKKYYPGFNSKYLIEKKIFEKVYPNKKFSGTLMRKVISLINNLAMDFIAVSGFRENKLEFNVKLYYDLYERNLNKAFEKKTKSIEKLLQESRHTPEYYHLKFKYTSKLNGYLSNHVEVPDYQKELEDFIVEFLVIVLHLYHRMCIVSNIYNTNFELKFFNDVISFINSHNYTNVTLVSLYYNLVMLVKTQDEKYFYNLIELGDKFRKKLTDTYQYNLYITLIDFCLNRIYKGDIQFRYHYFNLSKKYFENNTIPKEIGCISSILFTSIIRNSAYLKEFEWIDEFKNKYLQLIERDKLDEALNYSNASIEFEKGNFDNSLKLINKVNPDKLTMKINARNLQIMVYFELGYIDLLVSQIDSYKHYFKRNSEIGETLKQRNIPFIKSVSDLVKVRHDENNESAILLKKKIETSVYFSNKECV
jgi:hypothetical protein